MYTYYTDAPSNKNMKEEEEEEKEKRELRETKCRFYLCPSHEKEIKNTRTHIHTHLSVKIVCVYVLWTRQNESFCIFVRRKKKIIISFTYTVGDTHSVYIPIYIYMHKYV